MLLNCGRNYGERSNSNLNKAHPIAFRAESKRLSQLKVEKQPKKKKKKKEIDINN